jgi:hypothetical protein
VYDQRSSNAKQHLIHARKIMVKIQMLGAKSAMGQISAIMNK